MQACTRKLSASEHIGLLANDERNPLCNYSLIWNSTLKFFAADSFVLVQFYSMVHKIAEALM